MDQVLQALRERGLEPVIDVDSIEHDALEHDSIEHDSFDALEHGTVERGGGDLLPPHSG